MSDKSDDPQAAFRETARQIRAWMGEPRAQAPAPRRPGRPRWTDEEILATYQAAKAATQPPRTPERIAEKFITRDGTEGISLRQMERLLPE